MVEQRRRRPFTDLVDFRARTHFARDELRTLAKAGALNPLTTHRRQALWSVEEEFYQDELFIPDLETSAPLPPMEPIERLTSDFETMRLTVGPHPVGYLRPSYLMIFGGASICLKHPMAAGSGSAVR